MRVAFSNMAPKTGSNSPGELQCCFARFKHRNLESKGVQFLNTPPHSRWSILNRPHSQMSRCLTFLVTLGRFKTTLGRFEIRLGRFKTKEFQHGRTRYDATITTCHAFV